MRILRSTLAALAAFSSALAAQQHDHAAETLGTVHFATSCRSAAQPQFDRAVALLHSFEFAQAIDGFSATLKIDPSCAIAEWGIALSRWTNPMATGNRAGPQIALARRALELGDSIGAKTDREHGYLAAVAKLYTDIEHRPQVMRAGDYRDAMSDLSDKFPRDTEAKIFYAIALVAASPPSDKTYAGQLKAAAILEPLFKAQPDHPGLAHYLIHAYDVPPLASRAIVAAARYSKIAPSAPHALHVPSHTFTRVGDWQASITANIAATAAARESRETAEQLHASDYMVYAYLQTAQDAAAKRIVDSLPAIAARFDVHAVTGAATGAAGAFALAAIPARYALERGAWAEAAQLQSRASPLPYTEAMTHFARAIGASHTGDTSVVKHSIDSLTLMQDRLGKAGEVYWTEQVRIQTVASSALLLRARGRAAEAIAMMRDAADAEDRTEKSAVTPGPIAPARELLAEMLLETKDAAHALAEFRSVLAKEPKRFRSLYGALESARLSGDVAAVQKYVAQLRVTCARADKAGRPELAILSRH